MSPRNGSKRPTTTPTRGPEGAILIVASVLLCLLAVSACAPLLHRPKPPVKPTDDPARQLAERMAATRKPAILFIGNSYSFGVPAAFKELAAANGRPIRTGHSTYGGWHLAQHVENPATLQKLRSGHWDVVVIQEYSKRPALPEREREMLPAVRFLATEARQAGAIPILYQTWGRRDGDQEHDHLFPGDNFLAMNRRLREGYQEASRAAGGMVIVPAGDAWEKEVLAGRGNALFLPDGSHPSPAGDALTASVFFKTLFATPPADSAR